MSSEEIYGIFVYDQAVKQKRGNRHGNEARQSFDQQ